MAEQLTDVGRGITLCHESFGDPSDPPVLLVMGLGAQMIGWNAEFCEALAARGFHVVRFDNRDIGRSTHMTGRPPTTRELLTRKFSEDLYSLEDMADDAVGLLDALNLGPAHVVGVSLGGMIAQVLAARHPGHVRSLVSIMSNTGSRWTGQPALGAYRLLLKEAPAERDAFVAHAEKIFDAVGSRGMKQDREHLRSVAWNSFDRGQDPAGISRQLGASLKTGDRKSMLRRVNVPTLVIHGNEDRLVRPSGGRATAKTIPGARLVVIEGMGHDLPREAWPQMLDGISETAARATSNVAQGSP